MNDTSPEMEKKFKEVLMSRSGVERLKMGCSMFDAAKKMVISSILAETPSISAQQLKERVLLRLYGQDFSWTKS